MRRNEGRFGEFRGFSMGTNIRSWSEHEDETLRSLAVQGHTSYSASFRMQRSARAIELRAQGLGIKITRPPSVVRGHIAWTEEREERLKKLWAEGLSSS